MMSGWKPEFDQYLTAIELPKVLVERIYEIFAFYSETCPEDIERIFVSDYTKPNGTREYESLWLFSKTRVMEAKNFVGYDSFDMTLIERPIR